MNFMECGKCGGAYGIGAGCICAPLPKPPAPKRMDMITESHPERLPALFKARGRLLIDVAKRLSEEINENRIANDLLTMALIELESMGEKNVDLINGIRKHIQLGAYESE